MRLESDWKTARLFWRSSSPAYPVGGLLPLQVRLHCEDVQVLGNDQLVLDDRSLLDEHRRDVVLVKDLALLRLDRGRTLGHDSSQAMARRTGLHE
ncbi:hypothetical protein N9L68_02105 [bacterium]|nr:hypothetical protein [bacterium]